MPGSVFRKVYIPDVYQVLLEDLFQFVALVLLPIKEPVILQLLFQ